MKNKFSLFLFSLTLTFFLGISTSLFACSCVGMSPCGSFYSADLIFSGTPTSEKKRTVKLESLKPAGNQPSADSDGSKEVEIYEFDLKVSEIFGGTEKISQVTMVSEIKTNCDFFFEKDKTYLVYARKTAGGSYTTDVCSGTKELAHADADLKFLRATLPGPPEVCVSARLNSIDYFRAFDASGWKNSGFNF